MCVSIILNCFFRLIVYFKKEKKNIHRQSPVKFLKVSTSLDYECASMPIIGLYKSSGFFSLFYLAEEKKKKCVIIIGLVHDDDAFLFSLSLL
jgi:hypothetical protein